MTQRHRLSNGLTVLVKEQHQVKVAAFQVWVKAGSADERGITNEYTPEFPSICGAGGYDRKPCSCANV